MWVVIRWVYLASNTNIVQYAQRAIMKITRFMKLKTFTDNPADLLLERSQNPLKRTIVVSEPSCEYTTRCLAEFRQPLETEKARNEPYVVQSSLRHQNLRFIWQASEREAPHWLASLGQ